MLQFMHWKGKMPRSIAPLRSAMQWRPAAQLAVPWLTGRGDTLLVMDLLSAPASLMGCLVASSSEGSSTSPSPVWSSRELDFVSCISEAPNAAVCSVDAGEAPTESCARAVDSAMTLPCCLWMLTDLNDARVASNPSGDTIMFSADEYCDRDSQRAVRQDWIAPAGREDECKHSKHLKREVYIRHGRNYTIQL